jgi:integrase
MAIFKRGQTWWVDFASPNGQRIRRSSGTSDKQQAKEFHDKLKSNLWRVHKLGEKPERTWQEAAVRWISQSDHKADKNKDIAKLKYLDTFLGNKLLSDIDRDLLTYISDTKKGEASASTANRYMALVRAILRAARDQWEWLDRVPSVPMFKEPRKRVRWITRAQAQTLVDELPEHLADLAIFTLATGLRQSNASFLRWDQVDLCRAFAWIHPDQSKSGRAISVPLNEDALIVLRRRLNSNPEYVFTYLDKPVARTSTKAWYASLKRAGIEDFRWHDLRHTWASWHVQNGTTLQELMELGGWASFEMVLRYAHFASSHLKHASRKIEGSNLINRNDQH